LKFLQSDELISAHVQDYAKAVYALEVRGGEAVSTTDLAERLRAHPKVTVVRYPGLGGLLSFDVADGAAARRVETSTKLVVNATSLGGVTSVMESRYRWEGDRVPAGLLRFSAGLEDAAALWADLAQALDALPIHVWLLTYEPQWHSYVFGVEPVVRAIRTASGQVVETPVKAPPKQ